MSPLRQYAETKEAKVMKTLLVGFKKYATHLTNPSEEVLSSFLGKKNVQTLLLEASYDKSKRTLEKAIEKDRPDLIVVLNLSPYQAIPALEQYAYNQMDSMQPDETGVVKKGEEIFPGEAKSLSTSFDLSSLHQSCCSAEKDCSVSVDGGRFFDNEAYYIALRSGVPSLMLHLPLEGDFPVEEDVDLISLLVGLAEKNLPA